MISYLPNPSDLKKSAEYLLAYAKNPVQQIKVLPEWSWPTLVAICVILTAAIGAISGLVHLRVVSIIYGTIIYPISTLLIVSIFTGFFYYTLLFFFSHQAPLKKVATLCFLSGLPWIVLAPFIDFVPPLSPVGIIFSGLLATVALSENFHMDKRTATRLLLLIVSVFLIFWIANLIRVAQFSETDSELIAPESLEILEKEFDTN